MSTPEATARAIVGELRDAAATADYRQDYGDPAIYRAAADCIDILVAALAAAEAHVAPAVPDHAGLVQALETILRCDTIEAAHARAHFALRPGAGDPTP